MAIAIPLKSSGEVDLVKPLKTFVANTYDNVEDGGLNNSLSELNKLRTNAVCKPLDRHENSLDLLTRYYDQLSAIENKLPLAENQIRINFSWYDGFEKGSFFGGGKKQKLASGSFEKVCVLYNIGAMHSQIATSQNPDSDEGLKKAAKHFQHASGIFKHLKDTVYSQVATLETYDLYPETLSALSAIMLAQAQETFFVKAVTDKMKSVVVAKLAAQACELYNEAMKSTQVPLVRDYLPKEWQQTCSAKMPYFSAQARFHQSIVAHDAKAFGEEIARLQHAQILLETANLRGGATISFKDTVSKVKRSLESAEKDNNFIYHEKIPGWDSLPTIDKAAIAKPLPVEGQLSSKFRDLFEGLVPLQVHHALSSFDSKKNEVVQREIGKLRDNTQLLNRVLATLNLPAAIEDVFGGDAIPASVLEKARNVQSKGGLGAIDRMRSDLPELLQRNKEILDEADRMLDEEMATDQEMRSKFKEKWSRMPSEKLAEPLRIESAKYRGILNNAIQADHVVKQRYDDNKDIFILLSGPETELAGRIPSGNASAALKDSPVVKELRELMEQVATVKAERDAMEQELKDITVDMKSTFLSALVQDGSLSEDQLTQEHLDRTYGGLVQQVQDSVQRQETLMANVERANMQFTQQQQANTSGHQREEMLKKLASSHDSYIELLGNLQEGSKFYNDLTPLLLKFQNKVSDLVFARKTEKEELLKDLQKEIVSQPTPPIPQRGGAEPKEAPPRPPPPTLPPQNQSQPPQPQPRAPTLPQASAPLPAFAPAYGAAAAPAGYPYPAGYTPPPMPTGYNPYAGGMPQPNMPYPHPPQQPFPQQQYQYPQQNYPGYPGYPNQ